MWSSLNKNMWHICQVIFTKTEVCHSVCWKKSLGLGLWSINWIVLIENILQVTRFGWFRQLRVGFIDCWNLCVTGRWPVSRMTGPHLENNRFSKLKRGRFLIIIFLFGFRHFCHSTSQREAGGTVGKYIYRLNCVKAAAFWFCPGKFSK